MVSIFILEVLFIGAVIYLIRQKRTDHREDILDDNFEELR